MIYSGGGHSSLGYVRCTTKKTLLFFRSLSPKGPHFYQLSPNDPLFLTNSLSPKDPDTSLSLKDPSFSHLIVKQVTIFGKKKWIYRKFRQIWRKVEKFLAILALKAPFFFMHFTKRTLFLGALSLKDPLFWRNLSPKAPCIWGAWWHSYVTFICECPRGYIGLIMVPIGNFGIGIMWLVPIGPLLVFHWQLWHRLQIGEKVYFKSQILVHKYWTILDHFYVPVL